MGAVEGLLLLLGGVAPLLGVVSWHTLHYLQMAFWERDGQMPKYACLMYVDDHLVGRYDKHTHQCVPQSSWIEEIRHDDADFWARSSGWCFGSDLVVDLMILKNLYNQSRGIHTLQAFFGCELEGEDGASQGFVRYGYNGRDFLTLDLATLTWTAMSVEAEPIKRKWDAEWDRSKFWGHFLAICPDGLHTHLRYGKETLLRIDPPTGHVARKAGSDGLETLVCRLHGFHPKEIDVKWQKDGEDQKPETLTGGVVPNSDGTYHTWLSIAVDPRERGRYRCRVEHDGLPEPLDLAWEEPEKQQGGSYRGAPSSEYNVLAVLAVVGALGLLGVGVTFYIKKQRGGSYQRSTNFCVQSGGHCGSCLGIRGHSRPAGHFLHQKTARRHLPRSTNHRVQSVGHCESRTGGCGRSRPAGGRGRLLRQRTARRHLPKNTKKTGRRQLPKEHQQKGQFLKRLHQLLLQSEIPTPFLFFPPRQVTRGQRALPVGDFRLVRERDYGEPIRIFQEMQLTLGPSFCLSAWSCG